MPGQTDRDEKTKLTTPNPFAGSRAVVKGREVVDDDLESGLFACFGLMVGSQVRATRSTVRPYRCRGRRKPDGVGGSVEPWVTWRLDELNRGFSRAGSSVFIGHTTNP
jgi:hypothetical protein